MAMSLAGAAVLSAACSASGPTEEPAPPGRPGPVIRLASFDFAESQAVAEFYAQALRERGFRVSMVAGLGPREIVEPALEQDVIDFVPEYTGTALRFVTDVQVSQSAEPATVHRRLVTAFAARGVAVLAAAPAQDQNVVVVSADTARRHGLRAVSDLVPLSDQLVFGGPPECPRRPLCLLGLQATYGLRFATFQPMPNRTVTFEALQAGEIDVGLMESSDPRLTGGRLTVLADDRGLQPPENIVPVVRQEIVDAYGAEFVTLVDSVSATLTDKRLIELNRRAQTRGPAKATPS
jgi:osmoprotectant transport system substrate-binding protein